MWEVARAGRDFMARIRPVRAMVFRLQAAANLSLAKARAFDVNVWSAKNLPLVGNLETDNAFR